MSTDAALRKRRSRSHARGDHSLCLPGRCPDAPGAVEPPPPEPVGSAGAAFLESLGPLTDLPAAVRPLAERYARHLDIAVRLEAVMDGDRDEWLSLQQRFDGDVVRVVVTPVLTEHRAQSESMRKIAGEIRQSMPSAAAPTGPTPAGAQLAAIRDELKAARDARAAAG